MGAVGSASLALRAPWRPALLKRVGSALILLPVFLVIVVKAPAFWHASSNSKTTFCRALVNSGASCPRVGQARSSSPNVPSKLTHRIGHNIFERYLAIRNTLPQCIDGLNIGYVHHHQIVDICADRTLD